MTDHDLLGYALIHAETDLALFHRDHVRQLYVLAGEPWPCRIVQRQFWSMSLELVQDLVAKARARLI